MVQPKITIIYTKEMLKRLILKDLEERVPGFSIEETNIKIMVKSTQNYKSEWENAEFKATIDI